MKKIAIIVLSALLAVSAAACGSTAEVPDKSTTEVVANQGVQNPMREVESLQALNALVGGKLTHPGVMGVSDEKYFTIESGEYTIAEYDFSINGTPWSLRFVNNTTEDISGVYENGKTVFADTQDTIAQTEDCTLGRWFNVDGQYVLMIHAGDIDKEWFKGICEEMEQLTMGGDGEVDGDAEQTEAFSVDALTGDWGDAYSQRATMTVAAGGKITVSWSSSAFANTTWTMTVSELRDGKLSYTDCKRVETEYADDGSETETVVYENGKGYFTYADNKLLWDGAADENCRSCTFEQM